jgi:hypothetical protein
MTATFNRAKGGGERFRFCTWNNETCNGDHATMQPCLAALIAAYLQWMHTHVRAVAVGRILDDSHNDAAQAVLGWYQTGLAITDIGRVFSSQAAADQFGVQRTRDRFDGPFED